jgi:hypothetical protein
VSTCAAKAQEGSKPSQKASFSRTHMRVGLSFLLIPRYSTIQSTHPRQVDNSARTPIFPQPARGEETRKKRFHTKHTKYHQEHKEHKEQKRITWFSCFSWCSLWCLVFLV